MKDDDRLVRLAAEIADGAAIEWDRVRAACDSEDERELLRELQVLERLAEVHAHAEWLPDGSEDRTLGKGTRVARLNARDTWGPLRIVAYIGGGTFGEVYRAFDVRLDREVALKVLRPRATCHSSLETLPESAVVEEGRLMARVRHPGTVTVYGAERIGGQVGVWMELVDGRTLAEELAERGPLGAEEVRRIGAHLADALAAVHRAGILHRDIKAQNVMRDTSGRLVLMDFGTGLDRREEAGAMAGTPLYLAPEVLAGGEASKASDIYSLGVLLFHLATGGFPVEGATLALVRRAHVRNERRGVRVRCPQVPRRLASVIDRAIAPDPTQRFGSAEMLAGALRRADPLVRRRRMFVAAGAGVLGIAAALSLAPRQLRNDGTANVSTGIVEQQIDPDLQRRVQVRGPAVGPWIPCHPRGTRGVAVCDLRDGSARPLRMPQSRQEFSPAMRAVLSPDGKRLAYQWISKDGEGSSVNVIGVDGSGDHQVYRSSTVLDIQKWTADGRGILVREAMGRPNQRALWVPASGGEPRILMHLEASVTAADLSRDGTTMLVTRAVGGQHDFSAVDVASGAHLWSVAESTDDFEALWTPDDRGVVFVTDRSGCEAIAYLPVAGGRPSAPVSIIKDLGRNRAIPQGFSPDGSYLVRLDHARRTAFQSRVDLTLGSAEAPRPLAVRCKDDSMGADWDPAGERVAFLSGGLVSQGAARIVIQSRSGRIEREIAAPGQFSPFGRVRWSPDGKTLAVVSRSAGGANVLSLLDLITGEQRELGRELFPTRQDDQFGEVRWSADGRTLYFQRDNHVHMLDLSTSAVRVIYRSATTASAMFAGFDVRRSDGALLVLETANEGKECVLRVMAPGSVPVDRARLAGLCLGAAWVPDGMRMLAATMTQQSHLWLLEHEEGEPTRLPIESDAFWDLSMSPDGRELLFSAGNPRPNMVILKGFAPAR